MIGGGTSAATTKAVTTMMFQTSPKNYGIITQYNLTTLDGLTPNNHLAQKHQQHIQ